MEKIIEKLSQYGGVKTCKVVNNGNVVVIVITKGFSQNARSSFSFLNDCMELFPEHPITEICITESNFAMLVLTKKN